MEGGLLGEPELVRDEETRSEVHVDQGTETIVNTVSVCVARDNTIHQSTMNDPREAKGLPLVVDRSVGFLVLHDLLATLDPKTTTIHHLSLASEVVTYE